MRLWSSNPPRCALLPKPWRQLKHFGRTGCKRCAFKPNELQNEPKGEWGLDTKRPQLVRLNAIEASTGSSLLNLVAAVVQEEMEAVGDGGPIATFNTTMEKLNKVIADFKQRRAALAAEGMADVVTGLVCVFYKLDDLGIQAFYEKDTDEFIELVVSLHGETPPGEPTVVCTISTAWRGKLVVAV